MYSLVLSDAQISASHYVPEFPATGFDLDTQKSLKTVGAPFIFLSVFIVNVTEMRFCNRREVSGSNCFMHRQG